MALSIAAKSAIRRHLNFPVIGLSRTSPNPNGGTLMSAAAGYRYHQAYGFLEYKLNNLNPDEEARLVGGGYAGIALVGLPPNPGDTLTVVFSGGNIPSPVTITVTAGVPPPGYNAQLQVISELASAIATNAILQTALVYAIAPYGTGAWALSQIPFPECAMSSPVAFSIAASGTGNIAPEITATGAVLPPFTSLDGVTTINGYIPILDGLEGAYYSTSQNLDTSVADVWTARASELASRMSLYKTTVGQLSDFLGIPVNPYRKSRPSKTGVVRYR